MKLVFMGTGRVSAVSLARLVEDGHELPLVVTRPDRPRGRSGRPTPPEVKVVAGEHGFPVHQPERVREEQTIRRLAGIAPSAIVVVAYNQLLPPEILAIPPHGCINVHLSLLPAYRGAAPVQHALLNGEEVTGATVMRMAERFDTGPILRQIEVPVGPDETAGELLDRLATIGAGLLADVLRDLEARPIEGLPQDGARASRAPLLHKEDGVLDWERPAGEVRHRIRAMTPWPSAFTFLHRAEGEEPPERLILLAGQAEGADAEGACADAAPGVVIEAAGESLRVAAGEGTTLRVRRLKRAGSRAMDVQAFLNGCPVRPGDRLGPA